ncbi:MAG: zinc-ribbon domain-containing protein [Candidatus Sulfotelmatobacter sp.]
MPDPNKPEDSTLPRPELNPLLNPVLASHMGRWAEVYFTNPPDKREEAVLELLRELESDSGPAPDIVQPVAEEMGQEDIGVRRVTVAPQALEEPGVCSSCGHANRSGQRFCGMCGTPISVEAPSGREAFHSEGSAPSAFTRPPASISPAVQQIIEESVGTHSPAPVASLNPARREPMWPRSTNDLPGFRVEHVPAPDRRRLYVATGVALLLAMLLYLGWRGAGRSSGAATQELQPASSQAALPSPQPAPTPAATEFPKPLPQHRPAPVRQTAPARRPPVTSNSTTPPPGENGSEELATAQKYLSGTDGETRDSGEAARWLWKAVGKQNIAAALLLSDLYLRGDGVPHNCDQARLLLDAAARKGKAEAAQLLSHLQAFGCQ